MSIFSYVTDSVARITRLTWFMIALAAVVYVVVMAITPGLKGQLKQVRHLVEVTVEEGR